jgi:hypothetical protein
MEGQINESGEALESAVKTEPKLDESGKALESAVTAKPKLNPKDPLRPRRKKARRACSSCQRAHLTCGMFLPALHLGAICLCRSNRSFLFPSSSLVLIYFMNASNL